MEQLLLYKLPLYSLTGIHQSLNNMSGTAPVPASPILKKKQSSKSTTKRRSVTFHDELEMIENADNTERSAYTSYEEALASTGGHIVDSEYGLCYQAAETSGDALNTATLPPSSKLVARSSCNRPELNAASPINYSSVVYNVLIIGDIIHGRCLMKQLESSPEHNIEVCIAASPNKENVMTADFILILLPLEVIGSVCKVSRSLEQLYQLRGDVLLCCAAVGVSTTLSRDSHVMDLNDLHSLVMQHKLSYYLWCDAAPGSWPALVQRIAVEAVTCRSNGSVSRVVACSQLWPSDRPSYYLQYLLDQRLHRNDQDLQV